MRLASFTATIAFGVLLFLPIAAALAEEASDDCQLVEPDPVQISWNEPCEDGSWLFEPGVGCRMWDWHPAPSDVVTWSGDCKAGAIAGRGVMQWTEHERPIDRFEGAFVAGKRQGPGRYTWADDDWYVGFYENDVPNGLGTALIAGQTFSGQWRAGCFTSGARTVAIGVPLSSCERPDARQQTAQRDQRGR